MAKKTESAGKAAKKEAATRGLLEAVRTHRDALQSAGLQGAVIDRYEQVLKALGNAGKEPNAAVQVLVRDIGRSVGEFQTAIRKEFPGNAAFHAFFKANAPLPTEPREMLACAREVAKAAPDFASNLIKHALNASSVGHLTFLAEQLDKELGGADPRKEAAELEKQIQDAAARAFEGKAELAQFK